MGPLEVRLREDLVDHFVTMDRLPDGLEFPPDLKDRIWFDAVMRRLVFRGFMSKADFDRLCRLSDNWGYRRPLEDLFRLCTPEEPARLRADFSPRWRVSGWPETSAHAMSPSLRSSALHAPNRERV